MKLYVLGNTSSFYPDVMLVCEGEPHDRSSETSPCLLVEVLPGSHRRH